MLGECKSSISVLDLNQPQGEEVAETVLVEYATEPGIAEKMAGHSFTVLAARAAGPAVPRSR